MKTINWKNAILAGFLGTVLFDILGLILTGNWWDLPAILGAKTGLGLAYGVLGHYSNGILLAILFAGVSFPFLRPFVFRVNKPFINFKFYNYEETIYRKPNSGYSQETGSRHSC